LFVIDSVDTERMEEAKMELMRTAKCPDNQVRNNEHFVIHPCVKEQTCDLFYITSE